MRASWIIFVLLTLRATPVAAQPSGVIPASATSAVPAKDIGLSVEFQKLPAHKQQVYLAARRAMDYLLRNHTVDGRFIYGYHPALRLEMEGDNFLSQARACYALGRAAQYFKSEEAAASAKQSLLKLLDATSVDDPKAPRTRFTTAPDAFLNRLAANGTLLLAIHEAPRPQSDLLDAGDLLANYLVAQLAATEPSKASAEILIHCTGPALHGIAHSQTLRASDMKTDLLKARRQAFMTWWKQNRHPAMIPSHTAAYAEAFARTGDTAFSQSVFEMNDWLCTLQYEQSADPRRSQWTGGFMGFADGKSVASVPDVSSAVYAEGLVEACRVARQTGDLQRYRQYKETLERSLAFVLRHQYTEARVSHFAGWFQPRMLGAFHASAIDGDIRLDYMQHALPALVGYLRYMPDE